MIGARMTTPMLSHGLKNVQAGIIRRAWIREGKSDLVFGGLSHLTCVAKALIEWRANPRSRQQRQRVLIS